MCRVVGRWWTTTSEVVCALIIESRGTGGVRTRPVYYDGFHIFCDPGVPSVPSNGSSLHCEQLCENNQHVLEHNKLHVSGEFLLFFSVCGSVA